ncbi:MAG: hypothetical protein LUF92_12315 [Clostridiales bacterium]|nr:hypothetical protein [Clostridiales bacterium]
MSKIIGDYYAKAPMLPLLVQQKIERFNRNPDIAAEFEDWIVNKAYRKNNAVMIQGYTAEKLAAISEYMNGEAAFITLINLREQPEKTLKKIETGFKRK